MEAKNKQHYLINEAAELTGLSKQVIRKWETRYQVIEPKRLENGYRVYTLENLLTLKALKAYRAEGTSMKKAVQLLAGQNPVTNSFHQKNSDEISPFVKELIDSGTVYDEDSLIFLLKQANHKYGLEMFLQNTIQPFLQQISTLLEGGNWDESQETVSSLVVRDFLIQVSRNFENRPQSPHALGFCLPYELHEIPLQIMLLRLKMKGWRTTLIGVSPTYSSIQTLIKRIQPQKVLLCATTIIPFQKDDTLLINLENMARNYKDIDFYIGGRGGWEYTRLLKLRHLKLITSVEDLLV